jgi:hypothetical protein
MSRGNGPSPEFPADPPPAVAERRAKVRLAGPFPAKARVVDPRGNVLKVDTVVENVSAGGLYLRLRQPAEPGAVLFVVTEFTTAWRREARRARVATRGPVLRVEPLPGGDYGVAVAITRHRFI